MEFKQTRLDNGLTLIAELTPPSASMAIGFFTRTGSRDETSEVNGVSHFLEHMMFKGTARRTPFDVNREFDEIGANYNAFTSEENTVYYGAVLPEFQARIVDLLGDMLRPALRQEDFDTEKNVILEEIALYEDKPHFRLYEKLMQEYFGPHPLGQIVLGTPDSIKALRREQMLEYFSRRYSPTNITVVATGKLDWPALVEQVQAACGHWAPMEAPRDLRPVQPVLASTNILDAKLTRQHVGLMSPAPSAQSPQRYAAQLLSSILGDDTGSRLYYALVETAIAEEASCSFDAMDETGAMLTFLVTDPDQAANALAITRKEFAKFLQEGPTPAELIAAKNKIASASVLNGELPMGRLTAVGFEWIYRHSYTPLDEQIEELMALTADDVLAVARQYELASAALLSLGPVEKI